jgi:peptidoglycan hydrolase-like protein with peptidoglycan-binding domain
MAVYSRLLKVRSPLMHGEDVRAVQNKLNSLGYNAGSADGYFGNNTKNAVQSFQRARGLSADGIVGPDTWNKLFSSSSSGGSSSSGNSNYHRLLKVRSPLMHGEDVRAVQNKLNSLGYNAGSADGYFGNNTKNAVQSFQRARGLSADGIVGPDTWNKLFSSSSSGGSSSSGNSNYTYDLYKRNGLIFHIMSAPLSRIETQTILRPIATTDYIGINGGFFETDSYFKPPTSGESICWNYQDEGKFITYKGVRRIANYHENQVNGKAVDQKTLVIRKSNGGIVANLDIVTHVNEVFRKYGKSNILNIIGGFSPYIKSHQDIAATGKSAICIKGGRAYLIYCPHINMHQFRDAMNSGLGRGLSLKNTLMMDGSGSAGMQPSPDKYIGIAKRYIYNMIRVK